MTDGKPNRIHLKLNDILEIEVESSELSFDALEQKALGLFEYVKEQRFLPKNGHDVGVG